MTADHPAELVTLDDAREWLRALLDTGERCPCCTQRAQVYRRTIHATMARDLVALWRHAGTGWGYLPDVLDRKNTGDFAKLRYWGLVEEESELRPDGGRAGWWRVTDHGAAWIHGRASVPRHAHVYDGRRLSLSGPAVTIVDALGHRFSLAELLAAPAEAPR